VQSTAELRDLLFQVKVQNLPFAASFEYALYTHGYVMLSGYPRFRAPDEPAAKKPGNDQLAVPSAHPSSRCPAKSSRLEVSDEDILDDSHMATAFVSDAVLQCLLWGLYEQGKLSTFLQDGDVPNVRCPCHHSDVGRKCWYLHNCLSSQSIQGNRWTSGSRAHVILWQSLWRRNRSLARH
jgi:hypothetical protein